MSKITIPFVPPQRGISGVYKITLIEDGRCYIGSSVDIANRWYRHHADLNNGVHHSIYLQRVWDKYGSMLFRFEIIEVCEVDRLLVREQSWMDALTPSFNSIPVAGSRLGTTHTPEARAKISAANTGRKQSPETIEKRIAPLRGRTFDGHSQTPETRAKISVGMQGKQNSLGRTQTQEEKAKRSESAKAYWARKRELETA